MTRIGPAPGPDPAVRAARKAGIAAAAAVILMAGGLLAGWALVAAGPVAPDSGAPPRAAAGGYTLSGKEAVIHDLIGTADVVAGTGPDIRVEVTTGGRNAGDLRVDTGRSGTESWLRVIFPGDRFVYPALGRGSRTECRVRDDGTFGGDFKGGRRVRIGGSGEGLEAHADLRVALPEGARLMLHLGVGEVSVTRVNGRIKVDTMSARVTASAVRGTLGIDVGSGNVEAREIDGELLIDTGSGNVTLAGIRGSRADIDTGSGDVDGSDISASDLRVDTGSGGIDITGLSSRNGSCDTGSGGVHLELAGDVDILKIDTGSGDVSLRVPPALGAALHIETGSGGIEVQVTHRTSRIDDGEFDGTIGDGGGRIVIDTGSGGVRILPG